MKQHTIHDSGIIAISLLISILINSTTLVLGIKCPSDLADECACKHDRHLLFTCEKDHESVSMVIQPKGRIDSYLKFDCKNVAANSEIFKLLNFVRKETGSTNRFGNIKLVPQVNR